MPNHVKNVVKMEGITNLPLFVEKDGKRCFDFNKIILMPESLNIESGSMADECAMYYLTEKCTIPVGCLDAEKMKTAKGIIGNLFSKQEDETAWSNPEPIMLKLSEMYPEATIEHWWADEDMGSNDGYRVYRGGKIVEGDYCDMCSNEAYETYVECWGESECLYKDDEGLWQRRSCEECHGCD